MLYIRRNNLFDLLEDARCIAFVGAGGKTSYTESIAGIALEQGFTVAIATTAKIFTREPYALTSVRWPDPRKGDTFIRVGREEKEGKLTGIDYGEVERLCSLYDLVLVEADGAKRMPLKYPRDDEPLVPPCAERVFVVAGLDALGTTVEESVFRWQLARNTMGIAGNDRVDQQTFLRFFTPRGLLKSVDLTTAKVVLNKYDLLAERQVARHLAGEISRSTGGMPVIVSSLRYGVFYSTRYVA